MGDLSNGGRSELAELRSFFPKHQLVNKSSIPNDNNKDTGPSRKSDESGLTTSGSMMGIREVITILIM